MNIEQEREALGCPFCDMTVEVVMQGGVYSNRFWYVYHPEHPRGECILSDQKFPSLQGWNKRAALDQRQGGVVTEEMASKVLSSLPNFARYNHSESEWTEDVEAMRAALQSVMPVSVPDAIKCPDNVSPNREAYADGWNACRAAMRAAPSHNGKKERG